MATPSGHASDRPGCDTEPQARRNKSDKSSRLLGRLQAGLDTASGQVAAPASALSPLVTTPLLPDNLGPLSIIYHYQSLYIGKSIITDHLFHTKVGEQLASGRNLLLGQNPKTPLLEERARSETGFGEQFEKSLANRSRFNFL